ncbi:MAG: exonuclease [Crenarchaeota archaeon]|nr:exonuclease [Thermoproteota archaeon]
MCKKCSKTYSRREYANNRSCPECGMFLLLNYTKTKPISSISHDEVTGHKHLKEKPSLIYAAQSLRNKIGRIKEYQVVSETEKETTPPTLPAFESWLWSTEYEEALKLQKTLLQRYKGKTLEQVMLGEVASNEQGQCYTISGTCSSAFKQATYEQSRQMLISDLKVIPGIGPINEQILKQNGYSTVEDLKKHPRWKNQACDYMDMVDRKEVASTQKWLWHRLPKAHPLLHYLAGFIQEQDFAIIDIETLGLSERPIILIGLAKPVGDKICTSQFLLRDIQDEPSAIWALVSQLKPSTALITFNGRSFDIPYIRQRLAYYGLDASLDNPHFDVLHFTRRAFKNKLPDCRLGTVERYMGVKRDVDVPGALVPTFYETYLNTKNVGPLVPIVEHNKQDLLTLANLFCKLYEEWKL